MTQADYPKDSCVHELFEAMVRQHPTKVAVVSEGRRCTYIELNQRAEQLAAYLRTLGVGPDVLVGVCLERSIEMVTAVLGILKAGGAYLPLDPSHPPERMAFMLDDAKPRVLLTQRNLAVPLSSHSATVVYMEVDGSRTELASGIGTGHQNGTPAALLPTDPTSLAYVLYTSGSTGKPKGVQVSSAP